MNKVPSISDAEWEVMTVIWERSPITSGEVVEALAEKRAWNHRTIKTMLNRLVKKGALDYQHQGRAYLYQPCVSKEACVRRETRSFLRRIFDGAAAPALVHFVKNTELSSNDIEELKRILSEKDG